MTATDTSSTFVASDAPMCQRCIAVGDLNGDHLADLAVVLDAPTDKPVQILYQHPKGGTSGTQD